MPRYLVLLLFTVAAVPHAASQVLISEFQYQPASGDAEWVELYNAGDTAVNLVDWVLHDAGSARHPVSTQDLVLQPSSYLVIADDADVAAQYGLDTAMVHEMYRFPALNNGGDEIVIMRADASVGDAVAYGASWSPAKGVSVERRSFLASSSEASTWEASRAAVGATPGGRNSVAPPAHDLEILRLGLSGPSAVATVRNTGSETAENARVGFRMRNDTGDFASGAVPRLRAGDSTAVSADLGTRCGGWDLTAAIDWPQDADQGNDTLMVRICIPVADEVLLLNEVMYEPLSDGPEWVEYINVSAGSVGLAGVALRVDDKLLSTQPRSWSVPAGGFLLLSDEEAFLDDFATASRASALLLPSSFSLRNSGATLLLSDAHGTTLDSGRYDPAWHRPAGTDVRGVSLERLAPFLHAFTPGSWSSSVAAAGATPGARNSVAVTGLPTADAAELRFEPNPFSPDGDGHEDFCLIRYSFPRGAMRGRLRIFDSIGRLERTLHNKQAVGRQGELVWDGRDEQGRTVRIGMYPVLLEAVDERDNTMFAAKGVIVVARKL